MNQPLCNTDVAERPPQTDERGQRRAPVSSETTLAENTYRLDYLDRTRPYAFVSRHDQDALLHVADTLEIEGPLTQCEFVASGGRRVVRLIDNTQIFPYLH